MLTLLLGPDSFTARRTVEQAAQKTGAPVSFFYFPGDGAPAASSLSGGDLFGGAHVYGLVGAVSSAAFGTADWARLAAGSNAVYCLEESLDRRKTATKEFLDTPGLKTEKMVLPHGRELNRWIERRAGELPLSIDPDAVEALAVAAGRDDAEEVRAGGAVVSVTETFSLWQVDGELRKLAAYATGRGITSADVALLVPAERTANAFELVDAAAAGDRPRAALLLDRFLGPGGEAKDGLIQLTVLLSEQLRAVLIVQDFTARRVPDQAALSLTGWKPGRLSMVRRLGGRLQEKRVAETLGRLEHLDLELKSSGAPARLLLDMVLAQLSGR